MTPNQARNKLGLGKTYVGGDNYYMKSGLEVVGEEELEKREDKFIKAMEDLTEGIKKLAEDDFLKEVGKEEERLED
jgi:deoxyhypusine synthase